MKCKNCGGEIRLEDLKCPYCGSPNEEAHMHARDMQHYRRAFRQTQEDVVQRAGEQSRRAVRLAIVAFLIVGIAFNVFLQHNSYSFMRMHEQSKMKREVSLHRDQLEQYLEDQDYIGFASYYSNREITWSDELSDEYYPIYSISSRYRYAVEELMAVVFPGRYSDVDYKLKYVSDYLQDFYGNFEKDNILNYEEFNTPKVQQHLSQMADEMDALCVAYLYMTPEEAKSLRTLSRGKRALLIEQGLEHYTKEAKAEAGMED